MGFEVLDGGLSTTVQDLGRYGYERFGVPVAGAMDPFALRAANRLVGNPPGAAALEITVSGPRLRVTEKCLIAVTGADLGLRVRGRSLPSWMAVFVRRGWEIEFDGRRSGCRAYLAVAGGVDAPPIMGSRSTYLRGGWGGFEGRPLARGDVLDFGLDSTAVDLAGRAGRSFPTEHAPPYSDRPEIRVVLGPQCPQDASGGDHFTERGVATFLSSAYSVGPASDRMGYRLVGPPVEHRGSGEIISEGVPLGAVQAPPDGQPIVMMADRQTTGGYPKIAVVIGADLPLLAQCLPGQSEVRFRAVSVEEAQRAYRKMMAVFYHE